MKRRLQTRTFACTLCGARLLHDAMHNHVSFECLLRPIPNRKLVLVKMSYRPAIGGEGR